MHTEMHLHRSLPFPGECPVGWRAEGHFQWPSRTDEIEIRGHGKGLVRQIRTRSVSNVLGNPKNVQRKHLKSSGELSTPMHSSKTKQRTHGGNHLRADRLKTIRNGGNLTPSQREMGMLQLKDIRLSLRKNKDNRTTFSRGWQSISGLRIRGK